MADNRFIKKIIALLCSIHREPQLALGADIAALLPPGYAGQPGSIVLSEQLSPLFDMVVHTQPASTGGLFPLSTVQGVICLRSYTGPATLADVCRSFAVVKAADAAIPCIAFLYGAANEGAEEFWAVLHATLDAAAPHLWPDYIVSNGHPLLFTNPALNNRDMTAYDTGLTRLPDLPRRRGCYVCSTTYSKRHFFYDRLCPRCGDFNYARRIQTANLIGRVALVTGARVKIGYAVALKLLRAGATVVVTSRFPHDAARRYAIEPDYTQWAGRLHIYGLDMRQVKQVEAFIAHMAETLPRLDILVNNAAQTVRRPPAFYAHLMAFESLQATELPPELRQLVQHIGGETQQSESGGGLVPTGASSAALSLVPLVPGDADHDLDMFPPDFYDADGQQLDRRRHNSWVMRLEEVSLPEMLEVQLVNVTAPALFIAGLKDLMMRSGGGWIVNVSATEGQFATTKQGIHPHTNMAKAALNMLVHTSAEEYAQCGIWMNSVDPGWVSQQLPQPYATGDAPPPDHLPLDIWDGAARVCDPIFDSLNTGARTYGKFLKDYKTAAW